MTLTYEPGHRNPADYMSRHPNNVHDTDCRATKVAEDYIHLITEEAKLIVTDLKESNSDETLSIVRDALTYGKWPTPNTYPDVKLYCDIKDELTSTQNGIILRSHRICVMKNLQKEVVDLAHHGHQGMTRTKQLLREKVWFPGIDQIAGEKVKNCLPCQAVTPQNTREPTQVTLTNRPWDQVSCDFADIGNGEYIIIIIDDFTRYPEVIPLKTLTAMKVIQEMDTIFSRFGNPNILKIDNGPPFNSHEFTSYIKDNVIKHHHITPLWPEPNGEV